MGRNQSSIGRTQSWCHGPRGGTEGEGFCGSLRYGGQPVCTWLAADRQLFAWIRQTGKENHLQTYLAMVQAVSPGESISVRRISRFAGGRLAGTDRREGAVADQRGVLHQYAVVIMLATTDSLSKKGVIKGLFIGPERAVKTPVAWQSTEPGCSCYHGREAVPGTQTCGIKAVIGQTGEASNIAHRLPICRAGNAQEKQGVATAQGAQRRVGHAGRQGPR